MNYFVKNDSIVKTIWGNSDTILLIFAGAAGEFAINKAVDWLYYTGKLPKDPIGRLFSTVSYAKSIIFANETQAQQAIQAINSIHHNIELQRGQKIPDWAYRDVLFMLIDYSIRAYETLERKLTFNEKEDVFNVFLKLGKAMHLSQLPSNYSQFISDRITHLNENLEYSNFTKDLYLQYRKHLKLTRYILLIEIQKIMMPNIARTRLKFNTISCIMPLIFLYQISKRLGLSHYVNAVILPAAYQDKIQKLNYNTL